jgi:hypothetical protein
MTLLSLRTGRLAGEALLAPGATLAGEISFHLSDL